MLFKVNAKVITNGKKKNKVYYVFSESKINSCIKVQNAIENVLKDTVIESINSKRIRNVSNKEINCNGNKNKKRNKMAKRH